MSFEFRFPRVKFTGSSIAIQLIHLESEVVEVWQALQEPTMRHAAEELMDVMHSCETALRILQEQHGIDLHRLREDVYKKNDDRGYYDAPDENHVSDSNRKSLQDAEF